MNYLPVMKLLNALKSPGNRRRARRLGDITQWRNHNMLIKTMQVGFIGTNCYILTDETTMKSAVIDPGGDSNMILDYLERNKMECVAVILTHGHMDHTMGVDSILQETGVPLYMHRLDWAPPKTRAMDYRYAPSPKADVRFIDEGDEIAIGNLKVYVLHTPGHTPGGVTLMCEKAMFTGDTLFRGSCGRVDLAGGDASTELASLKRLAEIPGDYEVYPGHMETSTLAIERVYNPYMFAALNGVTEF